MPSFTIPEVRRANAGDAAVIYQMICDLEECELDRAVFTAMFLEQLDADNPAFYVVLVDEKVVGVGSCSIQIHLHHAARVAEVMELYVKPECRGEGVGKLLLTALTDYAGLKGATQLELASNFRRLDAHRFYEREGFGKNHFKFVKKV